MNEYLRLILTCCGRNEHGAGFNGCRVGWDSGGTGEANAKEGESGEVDELHGVDLEFG